MAWRWKRQAACVKWSVATFTRQISHGWELAIKPRCAPLCMAISVAPSQRGAMPALRVWGLPLSLQLLMPYSVLGRSWQSTHLLAAWMSCTKPCSWRHHRLVTCPSRERWP